jgi:predicted HTH transcriptional regulator
LRLEREELLAIIVEMAREEPVTNRAVRDRTGLDRQDVLSLLDELVESRRLRRVGERRGTRYLPS